MQLLQNQNSSDWNFIPFISLLVKFKRNLHRVTSSKSRKGSRHGNCKIIAIGLKGFSSIKLSPVFLPATLILRSSGSRSLSTPPAYGRQGCNLSRCIFEIILVSEKEKIISGCVIREPFADACVGEFLVRFLFVCQGWCPVIILCWLTVNTIPAVKLTCAVKWQA